MAALAAVFLGALDLTVIATVLPKMIVDLRINTADIDRYVWVVNAYLLAYIVAIPVVGRLSDMLGRTPIVIGALAVFVAGSLFARTPIAGNADRGACDSGNRWRGVVADHLGAGWRSLSTGSAHRRDRYCRRGRYDWLGAWPDLGSGDHRVANLDRSAVAINFLDQYSDRGDRGLVVWRSRDQHPVEKSSARLRDFDLIGALLFAGPCCSSTSRSHPAVKSASLLGSGLRAFGGTKNPLADYLWPLLGAALIMGIAFVLWSRRRSTPLFRQISFARQSSLRPSRSTFSWAPRLSWRSWMSR